MKGITMRTFYVSFLILSCIVGSVFAVQSPKDAPGLAITVYNGNFGVVRDTRHISFNQGINTIKFSDVASMIDPTSVNFKCLSAPDAVSILEQNFEYDLVSQQKLLKKYIGKNITLGIMGSGGDTGRIVEGILLSAFGTYGYDDLIIRSGNKLEIISCGTIEQITLDKPSTELLTKPTLIWLANSGVESNQLCRITYTTNKINWNADYSAIVSRDDTKLDISGWVTIDNQSGAAYPDAAIKLMAGDVRRLESSDEDDFQDYSEYYEENDEDEQAFEEHPIMDYHLYTLQRKSTINDNQIKQIEFIPSVKNVPTSKVFMYQRDKISDKVQVKIEFENKKDFGLGIALPAGKIRVFKQNADDNMLEFVGEDMIDHTPAKEKLKIYIGNAFDIVPEYKLLDSQVATRQRTDSHQIELRNRKQEAVEVLVDEKFSKNVNWTIDKSSHEYEKTDATTARFKIKIPADSVQTVTYTATQTW
jgi:hypothetical protein